MQSGEVTLTTLCYLTENEKFLLLNRNKKLKDENKGKWIGLGGHFLQGEDPFTCMRREFFEESGLTLHNLRLRALVTFVQHKIKDNVRIKTKEQSSALYCEYMFLFTANKSSGTLHECREGTLAFIQKKDLDTLPMWQGDRVFLRLLDKREDFFSLKLEYEGETLVNVNLDGEAYDFKDAKDI